LLFYFSIKTAKGDRLKVRGESNFALSNSLHLPNPIPKIPFKSRLRIFFTRLAKFIHILPELTESYPRFIFLTFLKDVPKLSHEFVYHQQQSDHAFTATKGFGVRLAILQKNLNK
jgi:hypothetical protein